MGYRGMMLASVLAATLATQAFAGGVRSPDPVVGKWRNPRGTLAVQTGPCGGGGLCGSIVWASDQALADARNAGVPGLIGTQLLQGYRRSGQADWSGRVYVPDMGRTFSSRIRQTSAATLTISGCLVGNFLCKSQVWYRIAP